MPLPAWLAGFVEPASKIIDSINAPAEERGKLRLALIEAQIGLAQKWMETEAQLVEAQSKVVIAEAQAQSWLQRNWRPSLMALFGLIIAWNFVVVPLGQWILAMASPETAAPPVLPIPDPMWTLLQLGVGGYVAGRSAEKIVGVLADKGLTFRKDDAEKS